MNLAGVPRRDKKNIGEDAANQRKKGPVIVTELRRSPAISCPD
jgi:hypothetical protein